MCEEFLRECEAVNGEAEQFYREGKAWMVGEGPPDFEEAFRLLSIAAELGARHEDLPEMLEAARWGKEAAIGVPEAMYELGECYYDGKGVPVDYALAVEWYVRASDQGNLDAQYKIGVCGEYGHGVDKNEQGAFEWYAAVAAQGHADAQYNLGYCYKNGVGTPKDLEQTKYWWGLAAENGHTWASIYLSEL